MLLRADSEDILEEEIRKVNFILDIIIWINPSSAHSCIDCPSIAPLVEPVLA